MLMVVAAPLACIAGRNSVFGNPCTTDADCKDGRCGPDPFAMSCVSSKATVCAETCEHDADCRNHADDPATCENSCTGRKACKSH
jgi:hypothetical protein